MVKIPPHTFNSYNYYFQSAMYDTWLWTSPKANIEHKKCELGDEMYGDKTCGMSRKFSFSEEVLLYALADERKNQRLSEDREGE